MQLVGQTFFFLFISLSFTGCLGDYNRFIDVVGRNDNIIDNQVVMDSTWVKNYNQRVLDSRSKNGETRLGRDLDYTLLKPKYGNDGKIEYHFSFNEHFIDDKYIDYYFIAKAGTQEVVKWDFLYCNKKEIDPENKESYKVCLRDTRVIKQSDDTYRIGVNMIYLKKYGYTKQFKSNEDDLKIVDDVLNLHHLCTMEKHQIVRKGYWAFGVRYKVKCLPN